MIKRLGLVVLLTVSLSITPGIQLLAQTLRPLIAISPAQQDVEAGATFTAEVVIEDAVDLGAYEFRVSYDPTVVQALAVDEGGYLGSTGRRIFSVDARIDNEVGTVAFAAASLGGSAGPEGSGRLATITYEAVGPGVTDVHLHQVIVADTKVGQRTPRLQHGQVTVGSEGSPSADPTQEATATEPSVPSPTGTPSAAGSPTGTPAVQATPSPSDAATAAPPATASPTETASPAGEAHQLTATPTAPEGGEEAAAATEASSGPATRVPGDDDLDAETAVEPDRPLTSEVTPLPEIGVADETEGHTAPDDGATSPQGGVRQSLRLVALIGLVPLLIAGGVYLLVFLPRKLNGEGAQKADDGAESL